MEVEINHLFFEKYENDDINGGNIHVQINVHRKETMVSLDFNLQGHIISFCDVCLDELTIPISKREMLILKTTGNAKEREDENIVFVGEKVHSYNIEQILYEYIVTLIPMRKTHQEVENGTCNPAMLTLIEDAKNVPVFIEDERWEALKNIELK